MTTKYSAESFLLKAFSISNANSGLTDYILQCAIDQIWYWNH